MGIDKEAAGHCVKSYSVQLQFTEKSLQISSASFFIAFLSKNSSIEECYPLQMNPLNCIVLFSRTTKEQGVSSKYCLTFVLPLSY